MTALDAFARRLAAIPEVTAPGPLFALRLCDTLVAFEAARDAREGRVLASIFGNGTWSTGNTPNPAALAQLAATIRLSEIDDIDLTTCITASSIVVATGIFTAVTAGRSPGDLARGLAAGYAALLGYGPLIGGAAARALGVWPTLAVAPIAAAATACASLGLSAEETANAMRIALLRSAGRIGKIVAPFPARWYLFGEAVACGFTAARASAHGVRIDPAIEGTLLPASAASVLDRPLRNDDVLTISQKIFCASRQSANAIVAFRTIVERHTIEIERIERIDVAVPQEYVAQITQPAISGDRISLVGNQALSIAVAAVSPEMLGDVDRFDGPSPALESFAARVHVRGSDEFSSVYPAQWPARVTVVMNDGTSHEETAYTIEGDPGRLLSLESIARKGATTQASLHAAAAAFDGPGALQRLRAVFAF